jgi:hypothetical protein
MNNYNPSWDYMAKTHGLKSPQPSMSSSPDQHMYIFQPGSKYYVWNAMADTVSEIITSMDLVDIVTKISKLGLGSPSPGRFRSQICVTGSKTTI